MIEIEREMMAVKVEKATKFDLRVILAWLKREHEIDGEGFWSNRSIIENSFNRRELWVIRRNAEAVAFQVGNYSPDIVCVRQDFQRNGLGTGLFEATLARAVRDNVTMLSGECSPSSSWPFWQRHGWIRYGDQRDGTPIKVIRPIHRSFELPAGEPLVSIQIEFFAQAALYAKDSQAPLASDHLHGVAIGRKFLLERRVICFMGFQSAGDICVRIIVEGSELCWCKAKHEQATSLGVLRDPIGRSFYIDEIKIEK